MGGREERKDRGEEWRRGTGGREERKDREEERKGGECKAEQGLICTNIFSGYTQRFI